VTIVVVDLNGLKYANDQLGHGAGDALLRRLGEVLNELVEKPNHAARIGGDEFAVLMPGVDEQAAAAMVETIETLVALNNQYYSTLELSVSIGAATSRPGERLESVAKRADLEMYESKRIHYGAPVRDRRRGG